MQWRDHHDWKGLMKIWFNGDPERLRSSAFVNTYTKRRRDGLLFGYDDSTYRVGKQITRKWWAVYYQK